MYHSVSLNFLLTRFYSFSAKYDTIKGIYRAVDIAFSTVKDETILQSIFHQIQYVVAVFCLYFAKGRGNCGCTGFKGTSQLSDQFSFVRHPVTYAGQMACFLNVTCLDVC